MHDLVPIANSIPEEELNPKIKKDLQYLLTINFSLPPTKIEELYLPFGVIVR